LIVPKTSRGDFCAKTAPAVGVAPWGYEDRSKLPASWSGSGAGGRNFFDDHGVGGTTALKAILEL